MPGMWHVQPGIRERVVIGLFRLDSKKEIIMRDCLFMVAMLYYRVSLHGADLGVVVRHAALERVAKQV